MYTTTSLLLACIACMSCQPERTDVSAVVPVHGIGSAVQTDHSVEIPDETIGIDTTAYGLRITPIGKYISAKQECVSKRQLLQTRYKSATTDSTRSVITAEAGRVLTEQLINRIFPFWYGTAWDFNGITDVPGEGEIACGYFVSTTLKHAGLNVNRYKLAQKSAYTGSRCLSINDDMKIIRNKSPEQMVDFAKDEVRDGLYTVGLDYHVGFLLIRNKEVFFIHSSYLNREGVMIEKAQDSPAFASNTYILVSITHNAPLLEKWLMNEEVKIKEGR
ncbi:MAG: hypothetical protein KDD36_14425 [Flavobacteriales bacterium]|nr:hypothetical protein [Flavobacteriales bacterium]